MKITVDRDIQPHELVFTIRVTNPHQAPFGENELRLMKDLQDCQNNIRLNEEKDLALSELVAAKVYGIKDHIFQKVIESLRFSIDHSLNTKFKPICQEIYNWIYDNQNGDLKRWLEEFDPQRTQFYFDNDGKKENNDLEYDGTDFDG